MCMQADRMSGNTSTLQLRNILLLTSPEPSANQRECDVTINTEAKEITQEQSRAHMCRQVCFIWELFGLFAVCAVAGCMNPLSSGGEEWKQV